MIKYDPEYPKDMAPFRLLHFIFIVMGVASTLILLLSGIGINYLSKSNIVQRAEAEAIIISQSVVTMNQDLLLSLSNENSQQQVDISDIKSQKLDEKLRQFLSPFHIIKAKVFSEGGAIVYSTEPSTIGPLSRENQSLEQALSGDHDSAFQTKDELTDLAFENRFDIDTVATYVPIYNTNHEIVGAFEIVQDVTRFRTGVNLAVGFGVLAVLFILLTLFLLAFKVTQIPMGQLEVVQNKLHKLVSMDALTLVYNRCEILNRLKVESTRVIREDGELSIILIDFDRFKIINDNYGYPVGDEVLKKVAQTIQQNIRKYDSVGRYDGEAFLVVLPNSDHNIAADIAERVRQSIENLVIEYDNQLLPISVSAGVVAFNSAENNIEQMIKRADAALNSAKIYGRNKVMTELSLVSDSSQSVNSLQ